jgi:hypothetical protein
MHFAAYGVFADNYFLYDKWAMPNPKAMFLATKEGIEKFREDDWHKGTRSDGVEFWTTPLGLLIVVDELPELIAVNEELHYGIPDPDWLYTSLSTQQYLPRVFWMENFYATWYKTKAFAAEKAKRDAEYQERLRSVLLECDVPDTPEFRLLVAKVFNFDYYYHYCDDGRTRRHWADTEKEIHDGFKDYPKMLERFAKGFKAQ